MAETIGTAYIQIEPSFQGVNTAISKEMGAAGESGGSSFGAGFAKVMGGTGKVMMGAVAAGGAAVAAMGTAFVGATADVASYGDNIDKMSQKMGLSAQSYQEWDAVMQHSGTSMETMKASMKTLANAAETNSAAFEQLGITEEQLASMNQEQLFEATISALQQVEDDTQRTYLAGKVLGRGATELGALLNTSAEDTQAMRDRVRELGGVMSDDAVKAAAAYQDQLQDMQTAFGGLSRNLVAEFLPAVTEVMGGLTEIFSGNSEQGVGMITNGITNIMNGITEALPQLVQVASGIIQALASALMENLPQIAQTGMDIIVQLAGYIIENLPMLVETAAQVIVQLALGLAEALPTLIPTIVEVVLTIVQYLLENIDLLIDAAIQLMIGLATGLIQALPVLIEKAPQIIVALFNALVAAIPKLLEAGKQIITMIANAVSTYGPVLLQKGQQLIADLKNKLLEKIKEFVNIGKNIVDGIKKGISDAWEKLTEWFSDKIKNLVGGVKEWLGIESPSKVFASEVGKWIPAGIAEGIEDGMGVLNKTIDSMSGSVIGSSVDAMVHGNMSYSYGEMQGESDLSAMVSLLAQFLPQIADNTSREIVLDGDAGRLFRLVQRESVRNTQLVGTGSVLSATT